LVQDQAAEHPSQWTAIASIASNVGCTGETLRKWDDRPSPTAAGGLTTDERQRFKELGARIAS
jgi:hypothetical protein